MFTLPNKTKVLNLPEQVELNKEHIEANETAIKQNTSDISNHNQFITSVTNDLTAIHNDINNINSPDGTITTGTLDVEKKATFGSNVEIDGKLTINSTDDLSTIDGSSFGPKKVIFDTDWFYDVDDYQAIKVIRHFEKCNKCKLIGANLSHPNEKAVESFADGLLYEGFGPFKFGVDKESAVYSDQFQWQSIVINNYNHAYTTYAKCEDSVVYYRKLLSGLNPNEKVIFIITGSLTSIDRLFSSQADSISSKSGAALLAEHCDMLYIMGGDFPTGDEYNFKLNPTHTYHFLKNYPGKITFLGFTAGLNIYPHPNKLPEDDMFNIISDVFVGVGSWDPLTAIIAIQGAEKSGYSLTRGTITINTDGTNGWTDNVNGNHYYVTMLKSPRVYNEMLDEFEGAHSEIYLSGNNVTMVDQDGGYQTPYYAIRIADDIAYIRAKYSTQYEVLNNHQLCHADIGPYRMIVNDSSKYLNGLLISTGIKQGDTPVFNAVYSDTADGKNVTATLIGTIPAESIYTFEAIAPLRPRRPEGAI